MSDDIHSCSYYCDRPACVKEQRDELRQRVAELEADARRYRWLRDNSGGSLSSPYVCGVHGGPLAGDGWLTGSLLDAEIDDAIGAEGGT